MPQSDDKRPIMLGEYLAANDVTVRQTAAHFGISKSTVHKDITVRLRELDSSLYGRVREVLERNKALRHIRGGQATKEKYKGRG